MNQAVLIIEPRRVVILWLITGLHLLLLIAWWILAMIYPNHIAYALLLSGFVVVSLVIYWWRFDCPSKTITRLVIESGDEWELLLKNHEVVKAKLHRSSFVSPYACILAFDEISGKHYSCMLISSFSIPKPLMRMLVLRIRV